MASAEGAVGRGFSGTRSLAEFRVLTIRMAEKFIRANFSVYPIQG